MDSRSFEAPTFIRCSTPWKHLGLSSMEAASESMAALEEWYLAGILPTAEGKCWHKVGADGEGGGLDEPGRQEGAED